MSPDEVLPRTPRLASRPSLTPTEYRTKFLTRFFRGRAQAACYFLALTIFSLGMVRDLAYVRALRDQPLHPALEGLLVQLAGWALVVGGNVLVLTSAWRLGITGTFLGDYFGILLDDMVSGFPFNLCGAPMYYGSTMSFLGTALLYGRPAGLLLTAEVLAVYLVALRFEDAFTEGIYAQRDACTKSASAAPGGGEKKEL